MENPAYKLLYEEQYALVEASYMSLPSEVRETIDLLGSATKEAVIEGFTAEIMTGFSSGGVVGALTAANSFEKKITSFVSEKI